MNKRGQAMIFGVMIAVFAFIVAVLLSGPVRDFTNEARNSDNLDCDATTLTTGNALTCIAVDLTLPFFIITVIVSGFAMIPKFAGR